MQLNESSGFTAFGFGNSQWLYPGERPIESLVSEPQYTSDSPVHYAAIYGDSKDNTSALAIDESGGTGTGYDTVYVDANNDNRIDPVTERFEFSLGTTSRADPVRVRFMVTSGAKTSPYWVDFSAFPYSKDNHPDKRIHANLRNSSYYTGKAMIAGQMRSIAIADLNSNGLFNDTELVLFKGDRVFVDLNDDGSFRDDKGEDFRVGYPYARYTKIEGVWYSIVASPDGGRIEISPSTPYCGTVRADPMVTRAFMASKVQPCRLNFAGGQAQAIAGTYTVRSVGLESRDSRGRVWKMSGTFPKGAYPKIRVRQSKVVELGVKCLPLRIEPKVSRKDDKGTLDLECQITGPDRQIYRWPQGNPSAARPGIEVRDESGRVVVSTTLEYG